jgi:hypothetical protein
LGGRLAPTLSRTITNTLGGIDTKKTDTFAALQYEGITVNNALNLGLAIFIGNYVCEPLAQHRLQTS